MLGSFSLHSTLIDIMNFKKTKDPALQSIVFTTFKKLKNLLKEFSIVCIWVIERLIN